MHRTGIIRAIAVGLTLIVALPSAAASQVAADSTTGAVIRIRTVRTGSGAGRTRAAGAGLLVRRQGRHQRVDVLKDIADSVGDDWANLDDAPDEMRLHNRPTRATAVMRFRDLRLMFDSLMRVRFDSVTAEGEDLGPGPQLLGRSTRRVRVRRTVRMTSSRAGSSQVIAISSETNALVAPSVPEQWGANSVLSLTSSSLSGVMQEIFGTATGPVTVRGGGTLPAGLALRTVTRSETRVAGSAPGLFDRESGTTLTVDSAEVVSIERVALPEALFAAPVGYRVFNVSDEIRKLVSALDGLGSSLEALGGKKAGKPWGTSMFPGKPSSKP